MSKSCFLLFSENLYADSAVTDEAARPVKHRLPTHPKFLPRTVSIVAAEYEIQERLAVCDLCMQHRSLRLIPATDRVVTSLPRQSVHANSEHLQNRTGNAAEVPGLVLLPVPISGQLCQAAVARLAFA